MNNYSYEAITANQAANPGKYIAVVGAAHANTHEITSGPAPTVYGTQLPSKFPGLGQLLDVPAVQYNAGGNLTQLRPENPTTV